MSPRLLPLLMVACTPAAQTVGAWTSAAVEGSSGVTIGTTGDGGGDTGTATPDLGGGDETTRGGVDGGSSSGGAIVPPWVATITAAPPADPRLQILALEPGGSFTVVDHCSLAGITVVDGLGWRADGRLVGADAGSGTLWQADPCDCSVTAIDGIEPPPQLHALTERGDGSDARVFGVDDGRAAILELDLDLALPLAAFDRPDAAAIVALASDDAALITLLDRAGPWLQRIDPDDGAVLDETPLALPTAPTGLTRDPTGDGWLACDDGGVLWRIDAEGNVAAVGDPLPSPCRTLATPHGGIACIDAMLGG